jgi:hypothetical protein
LVLMSDDPNPPLRFGEVQKRLNLSRYLTRRAIDLRVGRTEMISEASVDRLLRGDRPGNRDESAA